MHTRYQDKLCTLSYVFAAKIRILAWESDTHFSDIPTEFTDDPYIPFLSFLSISPPVGHCHTPVPLEYLYFFGLLSVDMHTRYQYKLCTLSYVFAAKIRILAWDSDTHFSDIPTEFTDDPYIPFLSFFAFDIPSILNIAVPLLHHSLTLLYLSKPFRVYFGLSDTPTPTKSEDHRSYLQARFTIYICTHAHTPLWGMGPPLQ